MPGIAEQQGPPELLGFRPVARLRTVGGLEVRPGRLYRSATPQFTDPASAATFVAASGLNTIVDLRLPHEARQEGSGGFAEAPVVITNVPFTIRRTVNATSAVAPMDSLDPLVGTYLNYLKNPQAFREIIELMLAPDGLPMMIHCTAGKDRTGVAIAVILDALGVLRDDIVANYAEKSEDVAAMMGRLRDMPSYGDAVDVYPPEAFTAQPATLRRFFGWLDLEYGGGRGYLHSSGVSSEQLDALAAKLLDAAATTGLAQVAEAVVVEADAADVWTIVGDVALVHTWMQSLSGTTMQDGVRVATFADGGQAREEIVTHSDSHRYYTYTYLDGPIPLDFYQSTLTVSPHHERSGAALITWTATLQAGPVVVDSVRGLYESGLSELSNQFSAAAPRDT